MDKETLTFEHERETKNTIRYQEITEYDSPAVGTIYIQKSVLGDKPPKRLAVTIEAGERHCRHRCWKQEWKVE